MFYGFIQRNEYGNFNLYATNKKKEKLRYAKQFDNFKDCANTLRLLVSGNVTKKTAPRFSPKEWSKV